MKKLAIFALAAALSLGCVTPAFAAGPHHGAGRGLNCASVCQNVMQNAIVPGLQSLNERVSMMLGQGNANAGVAAAAGAQAVRQGNAQMTAPGLCANGACGTNYVDADGDGVCDNYGANCPNPNGGGNYVDADGDGVCDNYGTNRQGSGLYGGSGYGAHNGAGHHGGYRR